MSGPAAVSFDFTGTLAAPAGLGTVYAEVLARHGLVAEPETLERLVLQVWREMGFRVRLGEDRFAAHPGGARGFWRELLERVCLLLGLPRPTPFAAAELFERFAAPDAWRVFADVPPALEELAARGLDLAVVSNFDERLPRILAGLGLADRFVAVVWSARVGAEKPHPAIFETALRELGVAPDRLVHVGDRRREDVEGAIALGIRGLLVGRAGEEADLTDLRELPGLL